MGSPTWVYCVQFKIPIIPISVTAYNGNPCMRYCVQWKYLYAVLRTTKIPVSVTAYNRNPYMRYCVQRKSLYALLRTIGYLMKIHIPKIPGSPPAAAKIANQNPLLRRMKILISIAAYNENPCMRYCVQSKSLHVLLRNMEIPVRGMAYNRNPYISRPPAPDFLPCYSKEQQSTKSCSSTKPSPLVSAPTERHSARASDIEGFNSPK